MMIFHSKLSLYFELKLFFWFKRISIVSNLELYNHTHLNRNNFTIKPEFHTLKSRISDEL